VNVERLRASFLARAAEDAKLTIAAAEDAGRARLVDARRRAAEIVASARAAGEADARLEAARTIAMTRRRARSATLAARFVLYEELRRQCLDAAAQMLDRPSYPSFLRGLERAAESELGAGAAVELDAGVVGGVVARAGSRVVDYSLPALVERCVGLLGERVEELWR